MIIIIFINNVLHVIEPQEWLCVMSVLGICDIISHKLLFYAKKLMMVKNYPDNFSFKINHKKHGHLNESSFFIQTIDFGHTGISMHSQCTDKMRVCVCVSTLRVESVQSQILYQYLTAELENG